MFSDSRRQFGISIYGIRRPIARVPWPIFTNIDGISARHQDLIKAILLDHGRVDNVVEDPGFLLDGSDLAGLVVLPGRIETGKQKARDERRTDCQPAPHYHPV
jgi:hypothetical protein